MSPKLPRVTSTELLRALQRSGWREIRQTGSHKHLVHPNHSGKLITVAVHQGRIVPLGTLKAIMAQAEMTAAELQELL